MYLADRLKCKLFKKARDIVLIFKTGTVINSFMNTQKKSHGNFGTAVSGDRLSNNSVLEITVGNEW